MLRARALFPALLLAALLTPVTRADASYSLICTGYSSCQSKGYSNAGYSAKQGTSYWAMYTGTNCTNYVAYRMVATNGMPNKRPRPGVGNARDWGTTMSSITDSTPAVGSVAWWGSKVGGNHVAYVEKVVSSSEIWVSESNWSGAFDWRKITKGGKGWPQGFIHFADPDQEERLTATTKPSMLAKPKVGVELEVGNGTWSPENTGLTYTYQWLSGDDDIPGARAKTFTPTEDLLGTDLAVRVIVAKKGLRTAYVRTPVAKVVPRPVTSTAVPTVSGTPRVGVPLVADEGSWSPSTDDFTYKWLADGVVVAGATARSFSPTQAQLGRAVVVQVAARHPGYSVRTARSVATGPVQPPKMTATTVPSVDGTAQVGQVLTADPGTWQPDTADFSYRWMAGSTAISGATGRTLTIDPSLVGQTIRVQVAAKHPGHDMGTARSVPTVAVAPGVIARGSRPAISGTRKVGSTLTSSTGTWRPKDVTLSYRWVVANTTVAGATKKTFTLRKQDAGHTVTVVVTARRAGYEPRQSLGAERTTVAR